MATKTVKRINYKCSMCGDEFNKQEGNFYKSKSRLYDGNNHYITICKACLIKLYLSLYEEFNNSDTDAIERICQIFDLYYNEDLAKKTFTEDSNRVANYLNKLGLVQFARKSYIDTIREKRMTADEEELAKIQEDLEQETEEYQNMIKKQEATEAEVEEAQKIFGEGLDLDEYVFLLKEYRDWIERTGAKKKAEERLIKNICFNEWDMEQARKSGLPTKDLEAALLNNLKAGGWSPNMDSTMDTGDCFGTLIKEWEDNDPISEPLPEFKDVDKIGQMIDVFFRGHLAKTYNIKGSFSKIYDRYLEKYCVDNGLQKEDMDDDEVIYDKIWGKSIVDDD